MKKVKVISGLHKGCVGKVIAEKDVSFEVKSGTKEFIILKTRCVSYDGEVAVTEDAPKEKVSNVIQFRPRVAN